MYATLLWASLRFPKICKPLVIYRFYCMALFHSQTRRHMIINEPVHEISNNVVYATSKASDQPAHTRSLIRAFVSRLSILWLLSNWLNTFWSFFALKEAAEARLSLHLSKCYIVGNLMHWLKWYFTSSQSCTIRAQYYSNNGLYYKVWT